MSREIIDRELAFWMQNSPAYEKYFSNPKIKFLIELCDIITTGDPLEEILIKDFIEGLAIYPNEQMAMECDKLVKPVMDLLIEKAKSDEYRKFLIDQEISGDAILKLDNIEMPITPKEILLHISRTKENPITREDIASMERSLIEYKRKQYSMSISSQFDSQRQRNQFDKNKPHFNPESIDTVYALLKDFFKPEYLTELKEILRTGLDAHSKLLFLDNGNRLADTFKQLINAGLITGVEKKELEAWVNRNFLYLHNGETKAFTLRYLNDIISTNKDKCQKPILETKKDKATGQYLITKA